MKAILTIFLPREQTLYHKGSPTVILDLTIIGFVRRRYIIFIATNEKSIISREIENTDKIYNYIKERNMVEVNLVYPTNPNSFTNECNSLELTVEKLKPFHFSTHSRGNPLIVLEKAKEHQRRIAIPISSNITSSERARFFATG